MFYIPKKTREKKEFDATRVYPVSISQIPQIPKEKKKLFQTDDFCLQNQKKKKKLKKRKNFKNSKSPKKVITKKIVEIFGFFGFFEFFGFFDFFFKI